LTFPLNILNYQKTNNLKINKRSLGGKIEKDYKNLRVSRMTTVKFSLREVAPLLFAILIDILGFGLVYPVLTAMFTSSQSILPASTPESLRFWYLSLGFVLYPFFMFFGSSFMGGLSDKLGRKKVILICMAGLTIGFALMGIGVLAASLFLLFFGRSFSGLMAASMPVVFAAVSDLSPGQDKAVHMSYVALVQTIGFVLGPLLGGILSDPKIVWFFNFSIPFLVSACMAFIAFLWIYWGFNETFKPKASERIDFLQIFKVFYTAAKHRMIRILSAAFFLMQVAIALYLQLILIYYREKFDYESAMMGIFNAYVGVWFGIGLILIVPYAARRFRIEMVAFVCLMVTALSEVLIAFIPGEILLWLVAIPLAMAGEVGFTAMLASFSNAASKNEQGWAMGITGAIIALSFALTGFAPTLVPAFGVKPLIFIGALCMFGAAGLMYFFCKKFLDLKNKH